MGGGHMAAFAVYNHANHTLYIHVLFPLFCPSDNPGVLACLDSFMNIAMEQTEEYVQGQLKAKYGDCFIRGNNGTLRLVCVRGVSEMEG